MKNYLLLIIFGTAIMSCNDNLSDMEIPNESSIMENSWNSNDYLSEEVTFETENDMLTINHPNFLFPIVLLNLDVKDKAISATGYIKGYSSDKFTVKFKNIDSGDMSFSDFLNYETSKDINFLMREEEEACPPCVVGAIAVIGTIGCGVINANEADSCSDAYQEAVSNGENCSMEFEGGVCGGGDCEITCE